MLGVLREKIYFVQIVEIFPGNLEHKINFVMKYKLREIYN
jgi:hypothetical protein